jgi:hypothetical protein
LVLIIACGGTPPPPAPDAAVAPTISLRESGFQQAPGETYHCWYFQPDAPVGAAITTFHPVTSTGVHHLALFFEPGGSVRPDRECSTFGNWSLLWGAGVGTNDAALPDGVAVPMRRDGVYVLQIHILNATDQSVAIDAGVDLTLTEPGATYTRAGTFLEGNTSFTVPAHSTGTTVTTDCTGRLPAGAQLVGLFPHMHKLGAQFQTKLGGQTIYDQPWKFDAQTLAMFAPAPAVAASDTIEMRCIFNNPTDTAVSFGLSTNDEMCFGAFYYTPAVQDEIDCIQ